VEGAVREGLEVLEGFEQTKESEVGMEVKSYAKQKVGERDRCLSTEGMALVTWIEALGISASRLSGLAAAHPLGSPGAPGAACEQLEQVLYRAKSQGARG
jgi:hypothetical protein